MKSLRDCVDSLLDITNLDSIVSIIVAYLTNKSPSVKLETCLFLHRIFLKSSKENVSNKILKQIIPANVKLDRLFSIIKLQKYFVRTNIALKVLDYHT